MPFACPHCQKEIKDVVEQATMTERLKAKQGEIEALKAEVTAAAPKARDYDAVAGERDRLKTEIAEVREQAGRSTALAGIGVTDPRVAASFAAIHASEMSGREEKDRVPFAEFDRWAKDHPLLTSHIKPAATTTTPATTTTTTAAPAAGLPKTPGATATPAAPQGKQTPAQIAAYFASPEYRALKPEERAAKRIELQAQVSKPATAT